MRTILVLGFLFVVLFLVEVKGGRKPKGSANKGKNNNAKEKTDESSKAEKKKKKMMLKYKKCEGGKNPQWMNTVMNVEVIIKTDSNPQDISFKVQNPRKKGNNDDYVIYEKKENELTEPNHTYNFEFEVGNTACHRFIIKHKGVGDGDGDGITSGKESYTILYGWGKENMEEIATGAISLKKEVVCFGYTCG